MHTTYFFHKAVLRALKNGDITMLGAIAVTVEYPQTRQPKRLHNLSGTIGFPVVPLLVDPYPRDHDAQSYAASLLPESAKAPVGIVAALCLAAPIAQEVARLVAARQGRPPTLLLLDGIRTQLSHVREACRKAAGSYGGKLVEPTREELRERPDYAARAIQNHLLRMANEQLGPLAQSPEQADRVSRNAVDISMDWITHLIASFNADYGSFTGDVVFAESDEADDNASWPGITRPRHVSVGGARGVLPANPNVGGLLAAEMAAWAG
jgi:hypothetical protein